MRFPLSHKALVAVVVLSWCSPSLADDALPGGEIIAESDAMSVVGGELTPGMAQAVAEPMKIAAPPQGTDLVFPYMCSTTYEHSQDPKEGVVSWHHGRAWMYVDGKHHGYPYEKSSYAPRAAGASYNFGQWIPRRSYYFPYIPEAPPNAPYGYSPEPYYFQADIPAPVPPREIDASRRRRLFSSWKSPCPQCGQVH